MQVFPELISYLELIVPRAHWRPPTKNEILSRPKCRQGPDDCVCTCPARGSISKCSPKSKRSGCLATFLGYVWKRNGIYIYINIYRYIPWLYLGPPCMHAWKHETSLHRPTPCMHEPSSLSLYIKLIEAFAMWMLGPMHTHVSFFGETHNRQTSPIAFSICLYPLLFFFIFF